MIRTLHRWPGLLALALFLVLSVSGAVLSVFPAIEHLSAPQAESGLSVADLASRIQATHPGVEQIKRAPSGRITAFWFDQDQPGAAVIDPVWELLDHTYARIGTPPTLLERDYNIPPLAELLPEVERIRHLQARHTVAQARELRHVA